MSTISTLSECPNCGSKVKGMLTVNSILSENKTNVIKEYNDTSSELFCSKCGDDLYKESRKKVIQERLDLKLELEKIIDAIPIVTSQSPSNWEYEILGIVTSQSTTGTGVFTEFATSISDLFGSQSGSINRKLKNGENICFAQLRKKALDLGGNAIIATDIDYSEVGGDKGLLMICMAGTAIKIKNTEIFGNKAELINKAYTLNQKMHRLNSYDIEEGSLF